MQPAGPIDRYVTLVRALDRLLPGVLDEPDPVRGPLLGAGTLVRGAGRLADELPDALGPDRVAFLRAQLTAVEWTARRLAGQGVGFVDEVASTYGVRIAPGDVEVYRVAHRRLDELLPGAGPLASRLAEHRREDGVPHERLADAVRALADVLRERSAAVVALPAGEVVQFRVIDAAPWSALHRYLGGYRSVVTVNAGARPRFGQLTQLVAHEAYPGHHVERCRAEAGPGHPEQAMVLATSPQSLLAEGVAELGLTAVLGPGWGSLAAAVLAGLAPRFDGELAERLDAAAAPLARVRQDAALLLHDRRAPVDEVLAHLRRWLLVDDRRAREIVTFLRHPVWRGYTSTYVEGAALVRRWWELDPCPDRFRRLLDEPLTPAALRADLASDRVPHRHDDDRRWRRDGER